MSLHKTIFVTTSFISFHRWPEAAQVLPQRAYLGSVHRHKFGVKVEVDVTHNNRDIEFHDLKEKLDAFISVKLATDDWPLASSCEDFSESILSWLQAAFTSIEYAVVTVDEDGENGAILQWEADE